MQIIVKETNQAATLTLIDRKTGVNYVADYIGNTGALGCGFGRVGGDW